jgi:dephospho-CoA kinase
MPTIALTGNFGMGKTTALQLFTRLGAYTINIDDVVHAILEKPSMVKRMSRLLGSDVLSNSTGALSINKKRTAAIIFNDAEKRRELEQIIHPQVLKEIKRMEMTIARRHPDAVIIFEIPLLFEAGYERHFDMTIVVHATRETALKRLSKKRFSRDESLKRMNAQMPISRKKKMADYRIDNNGSIEKTEKRVKQIFRNIQAQQQ